MILNNFTDFHHRSSKALVSILHVSNLLLLYYLQILTRIAHPEIIEVLNIHGTVIASSNKHGSDKFYQRFANFVDLFKKSEYNEDFLEGPPTAVTAAYWAFLRSSKEEVSEKTDG